MVLVPEAPGDLPTVPSIDLEGSSLQFCGHLQSCKFSEQWKEPAVWKWQDWNKGEQDSKEAGAETTGNGGSVFFQGLESCALWLEGISF